MKPLEARRKICPIRSGLKNQIVLCRAAECMLWRWRTVPNENPRGMASATVGDGYCGLATAEVSYGT